MQMLLSLSLALFAGLMLSRLAKLVKLPAVTAYLVAGILVGPYLLGRVIIPGADLHLGFNHADFETYKLFSDVALGFIAFAIGNEFRLATLKKTGKLHFLMPEVLPLPAAIVLGAIASATAPAATLMVVRQYKAKGPLTDLLLPIVALDDAVGLVLFAVSFGVAKAISSPDGSINVLSVVVEPLLEVVLSLVLGAVMGFLFNFFERFFHSRSKRMIMSVTFVLLTVALSMMEFKIGGVHVAFSSLLVCMMLGTVFCNICDFSEELMDRVERWSAPLLALFFVISGAELELSVFTQISVVIVGVVYIAFRSCGKYFGAGLSARSVRCEPQIVKYLGITLLPQAGVALGMAMKAREGLEGVGDIVSNITLFSVLVYELVGPFLTKIALQKAGEITPEGKTSAREEAKKAMASK